MFIKLLISLFVIQVCSSARTTTVHWSPPSVMVAMIAVTTPTKATVTTTAQSTSLSVSALDAASRVPGSATATRIVKTVVMNLMPFVAKHLVTRSLNFRAGMASVYRSCGIATRMMIVVMKVMNLRIFAAIVIVQLVGDAAPPTIITGRIILFC